MNVPQCAEQTTGANSNRGGEGGRGDGRRCKTGIVFAGKKKAGWMGKGREKESRGQSGEIFPSALPPSRLSLLI